MPTRDEAEIRRYIAELDEHIAKFESQLSRVPLGAGREAAATSDEIYSLNRLKRLATWTLGEIDEPW